MRLEVFVKKDMSVVLLAWLSGKRKGILLEVESKKKVHQILNSIKPVARSPT